MTFFVSDSSFNVETTIFLSIQSIKASWRKVVEKDHFPVSVNAFGSFAC